MTEREFANKSSFSHSATASARVKGKWLLFLKLCLRNKESTLQGEFQEQISGKCDFTSV